MNSIHILLIEDNDDDAVMIRELLNDDDSGVDFDLTHETSLASGISTLNSVEPDLVLLDLSLPDSFGMETLKAMRERSPRAPIVVMTGLDDRATGLLALSEGAQDYLIKGNVDSHGLVSAIRYSLERKRLEATLVETAEENARLELLNLTARALGHHILNALTPMIGLAQLMDPKDPERVDGLKDSVLEHTKRIEATVLALIEISETGDVSEVEFANLKTSKMLDLDAVIERQLAKTRR
ncbi:MAG: response regulator [SAR202 cluster bacterium]|jgi:DNA-binding NarL/FixJ family response regulator|nr:response regulator [SAR202 cluster bacterium]MDP6513572.1 response regulator [SAR202 cluster bacterium]